MKLFVTGATGFIGTHFVQQALATGHDVVAQRRPGSQPRLPLAHHPHWIDRPLDQDFSEELRGCDVLVHLAAHTPNPPYAPLADCLQWNVVASLQLMQQAAAVGVRDFLVAGSCFEYGLAAIGQDLIHPGTELRPTLTYPISKAAASVSSLGLARHLGLRLQVLRIFQVYGEGEAQSRFWPSLKAAAIEGRDFPMSAGTQVRDFIHVTDVASQLLNALDFAQVEPGVPHQRNIGTGHGQSLIDFARYWWDLWQATGTINYGAVKSRPSVGERLVANIVDRYIG